MLKFFKKHPPKEGEERERLKKELFKYQKCVEHGFPSKPSALAYDPKLNLIAIGTKSGAVKVFGTPGFEATSAHDGDISVNGLFFIPEEGRLVSMCSDGSFHLWEINHVEECCTLEEKILGPEPLKIKNLSSCSQSPDGSTLYVGTEAGNIHMVDTRTLTDGTQVTNEELIQNVPEDFKVNPGAVEAIASSPTEPNKVLIGFNRGLIVLWDTLVCSAEKTYNATQQLESLTWHRDGSQFISAHNDGSYIVWEVSNTEEPKEPATTPYGPFPCKAIHKLHWRQCKGEPMLMFSGGMPRASYGDRHTVSIMQGDNHIVAELTSRVVDFVSLCRAEEPGAEDTGHDDPHALLILAEEEVVMLDLDSPEWPAFPIPYLHSVHSSAITCSQHVANVPQQLWEKLTDAGLAQLRTTSKREWPIQGGRNTAQAPVTKDLLLTGHEDGTVSFWDASSSSLHLMYRLSTCPVFGIPDHHAGTPEEEEWPPFRKVGTFDPYSDDPRLAIQKMCLCALSETLVVAGSAGQILIYHMERQEREQDLKEVRVNIMEDHEGFVWKGHEALSCKADDLKYAAGFQPTCVMQLDPPAACTALVMHSEWQLVAAGTGQGFALLDYAQKKEVATRCTLNPNDLTGTSESQMSRRKSLKKSLRESFRRLRRRRSVKRVPDVKKEEKTGDAANIEEGASATPAAATPDPAATGDTRPEERVVEARSTEDSMASMVRSLYFANTFILNGGSHSPSLWVGTNGGHVYMYSLTVPPSDKRTADFVSCLLAKEIKLKHHAPVLSMAVIDSKNTVLPAAFEVINERAKAPDMDNPHSIIICSEEQLKTFSLPNLKPRWKNKITAIDGARLRKINFASFRRDGDNYSEHDITCLTNTGDLRIFSCATLRKQLQQPALRKEDINPLSPHSGISSFVFTKDGQGLYLQSPSELARISLSTSPSPSLPVCTLGLAAGLRPPPSVSPPEASGGENPTVEVTPASEDNSQDQAGEADTTGVSGDDSRMDMSAMSADITVDSVRDVIEESGETIVTSSSRTVTQTTTQTVTETNGTATEEGHEAATTNGHDEDTVTQVLTETQHEVTSKITEHLTRTSEKIEHNGDEVTKELSELKMTTAVIEDPALLKQKLVDSTMTTITTVTDAKGEVISEVTTTTNGAGTNGVSNGGDSSADDIHVEG